MARGRSRRTLAVLAAAAVLVVVAGGVTAYVMLRTIGSPQQTAATYLSAWQRGDYHAMDQVTVDQPHGGLAGPLTQAATQLGVKHLRLVPGQESTVSGTTVAAFRATASLASGQVWAYQGRLALVERNQHWWVDWSPADIYPGLHPGQRFVLDAVWPSRAPVLAADGTDISSQAAQAQSGSLSLLTGIIVNATKAQAKALGAPYQAGDLVGEGGVEQAYQAQLAGRPSMTIKVEGPGAHVDAVAATFKGAPGTAVHTSIDMRVQLAASDAVRTAPTKKPVDMVAIQPSTGKVLAVVESPGGFDRALSGLFPPGSTFKIVTASALTRTGMRPSSTVDCPPQTTIDGRTFHNFDNEQFGRVSLLKAFAVSCNTTFAMLATQRLNGDTLASMAAKFGFNAQPSLGIPATLGHFTTPKSPVDLAADAFGQDTDLVNPLSEATMAGAIEDGTWRPPVLVTSPAPKQTAQPQRISAAILATLRPMMRAV
ncbi:MAG TPA: penicillin-binding transpeptidase domain-containing protein, partial [Streptosporangiaceae bacterium]|nr:penicillin-binding transpeptidase domain-containing protein [Streptosporangiaceae bacterium]